MTLTIGVDVDDVFLDMLKNLLIRYNSDYNDNLTMESFPEWNMIPYVKPECGNKIYNYFNDPTLYDGVELIPDALESVLFLRSIGHRVVFITHTFEGQEGIKYKILKSMGALDSKKDYYEAEDKSLICVDYLIDDKPLNIQNTKGTGILFNRPHNSSFEWTLRFDTWKDIVGFIQFKETGEYIYG